MSYTDDGQLCQTCLGCSAVGRHAFHDCACDWRVYGHEVVN